MLSEKTTGIGILAVLQELLRIWIWILIEKADDHGILQSKGNCYSTSVYIFFYSLGPGAEISKEIIYHCIKRGSSTQYNEATR